jgi:hypothetical protein
MGLESVDLAGGRNEMGPTSLDPAWTGNRHGRYLHASSAFFTALYPLVKGARVERGRGGVCRHLADER